MDDFETFWNCYPRKIGKKAARKAWQKATDKPCLAALLEALDQQKRSEQWLKEGGQFIPHPTTWLNQGRWDDVVQAKKPSLMEQFLAKGQAHGSRAILSRLAAARVATVGESVPGSRESDERRTAGYGGYSTGALF